MQDVDEAVEQQVKEFVARAMEGRTLEPIVHDGEIVGYAYAPRPRDPVEAEKAYQKAREAVDKEVESWGLTEDELMAEIAAVFNEQGHDIRYD